MNWIIRHSKLMPFHTHLGQLLKPLINELRGFQWLISDLDYNGAEQGLPINLDDEYFLLSEKEFEKILESFVQIIWGVVIALPGDKQIIVDEKNIPLAETNPLVWENGHLQHNEAVFEIICIDSSYTIVKFTDENLSDKFKAYFGDEAIELEKF